MNAPKRHVGHPPRTDGCEPLRVAIRMSEELHQEIVERAEINCRSFTREAEYMLMEYLKSVASE